MLSGPTARTPYRATGHHYTYRTYVFEVSQGIALHPRISSIAIEGRGRQRVSQLKPPSGKYCAIRGCEAREVGWLPSGVRRSNAPVGRIVLLPSAFWAHGSFQNSHFQIGRISFYSLLYSVSELREGVLPPGRVSHEPCFHTAHCFVQGPLRFLPVPPNPTCARYHIWGFPRGIAEIVSPIAAASCFKNKGNCNCNCNAN